MIEEGRRFEVVGISFDCVIERRCLAVSGP